jgi:hypothetical protein
MSGLKIGFDSLKLSEIAAAFKVTTKSVDNWVNDTKCPCPRHPDKTFSLHAVHKWLLEREIKKMSPEDSGDPMNLREAKLKKEIEMLTAKIAKVNEELIDRNLSNDMLASRAKTTSDFWKDAVQRNVQFMAHQEPETLSVMLMDFLCHGTEALIEDS